MPYYSNLPDQNQSLQNATSGALLYENAVHAYIHHISQTGKKEGRRRRGLFEFMCALQ